MSAYRTGIATWNTTSGSKTATITTVAGDFLIAFTSHQVNVSSHAVSDDNGPAAGTGTWSQALTPINDAVNTGRCSVWVKDVLVDSTTAGSTVVTTAPGATSGGGLVVIAVSGMHRADVAAIRQMASQATIAAGTPAPVLSVAALTGNTMLGFVQTQSNVSTNVAPRSSPAYSEQFDQGYNTPPSGIEVMSLNSGETATTITWGGATPTSFRSIIVEIDATTPNRTHTTDAVLAKTLTRSHTTDAVILETMAVSHTTDAVIAKTQTATQTTDATLLKTLLRSHTTDATLLKIQTVAQTADAVLKKTLALSHMTDALVSTRSTRSHTTDAVVRSTLTRVHTTDAVVRKTFTVAQTADAVVRRTQTVAQTADSVLRKTLIASHTTDAVISALTSHSVSHTTDATLLKTTAAAQTVDAVVRVTSTLTHLTDATVLKTVAASHTTDASIAAGTSAWHTTDAVIVEFRWVPTTAPGIGIRRAKTTVSLGAPKEVSLPHRRRSLRHG